MQRARASDRSCLQRFPLLPESRVEDARTYVAEIKYFGDDWEAGDRRKKARLARVEDRQASLDQSSVRSVTPV